MNLAQENASTLCVEGLGKKYGTDSWALRDVSFRLQRGEVLGVAGANGAGKSTLLKLLARVTRPSEGSAVVRGRMAALLEVGAGLHGELTGAENVRFIGALLGVSTGEIEERIPEIFAFGGVASIADVPLKRCSSGMSTRLAFSAAVHFEPDVLLLDEFLVGADAAFRLRATLEVRRLAARGVGVLVVMHDREGLLALSDRCLRLHGGTMVALGEPRQVLSEVT